MNNSVERSKSAAWDLYESQFASAPKPQVNHNLRNYGQFVDGNLESCMDFEKRWLCNRISKIHGKGFSLRKNHRLCRADAQGDPSKRYIARQENRGSKQAHDVKLVNTLTGNIFWYGFDHGK